VSDKATRQHLIIGLGNPGKEYELTRHNLGFLVVQGVAHVNKWEFKEQRTFQALAAKGQIGDQTVHLLLPTTYMNLSGQAARKYMDYYKIGPEAVLVVADDVDLPFGELRVKASGSAGGHNGLKSIESCLGTQNYARLRMGIGQKQPNGTLADYVLGNFTKEEFGALPNVIQQGVNVVMRLMNESIAQVMNAVNKTIKKEPSRPAKEGQENKNEST
jgi:PTH1 family peptidyl-tRNA hydrolase